MLKVKTKQVIDVSDWDALVEETYGRPYNFQQQDGCQDRGTYHLTVPSTYDDDFANESIEEIINGDEMGVSFAAWLARDPKQPLAADEDGAQSHWIAMFWERSFYPDIQMVANDLHAKGLIPAGEYVIDIDW